MQSYQDILFQVQTETEQIFFRVPDSYKSEFSNGDSETPFLDFLPWPIKVSSIIFGDGSQQFTAGGGGGGQNQTPWLSDIDADEFSLDNVTSVGLVGGGSMSGSATNPDQRVNITATGGIWLQPSAGWAIRCAGRLQADNWLAVGSGLVYFYSLPTSPDGLTTAQVWNNNGVLNIGPGGSGGSQTPWLSNIDAAGFSLDNVTSVGLVGGSSMSGFIGPNPSLLITGNGNIVLQPAAGWFMVCQGRLLVYDYAQFKNTLYVDSGAVVLSDVPTSPDGLITGQLWNNNGVLNIA